MLLGHWGTTPGQNFIYAHLNRAIVRNDLNMIFISGPGHGGPALQANTWLDCVEKNTPPYCTLDEALATLRVNQAAVASARQHGAWIEVAQQ